MNRLGMLLGGLWLPIALAAADGEVELPLLIDASHLAVAVAHALELDADGLAVLGDNDCNRVEMSDLEVATRTGRIGISMAVTATAGAQVMGRCHGPAPWQGRMTLDLVPSVTRSGLSVEFAPESAELVRPDGSPGPLSRPARMLAEAVILPRMHRIRLDFAEPLAAIDELIEQVLKPNDRVEPSLVERTRIDRLMTSDEGLRAWLVFQVRPAVVAITEPALDQEEWAQWQRLEDEFDGFLTTVIAVMAGATDSEALRLELLAVLLDTRHAIAEALLTDEPGADPVRELFMTTWDRLRPLLAELERVDALGPDIDFRLAAFIAGGDALKALDALGPEYGLEITRDGLRRLARLLLADKAPVAFTPLPLAVDPEFRALFGFDPAVPDRSRDLVQALADGLRGIGNWMMNPAHAGDISPAEALRGLVPRLAILDEYLDLVARLLEYQTGNRLAESSRVPDRLASRFDPLVRATAWKESCWRQYTGSVDEPQVLRSPIGAVGMMQINGRVWRSLYDLDRLSDEVAYNVATGIEILEHYLVDYAIRRGEHEHPGGDDNLIRATYAAYNGGPSHLSRYRREDTAPRLRAIDNEFWRQYTTIKTDQWPDIASCYAVNG